MSLQGITLAISPSGIEYFTSVLLANNIASALQNLSPPANNVPVGDICTYSGKGGSDWAEHINIALSNGSLSSFSPLFQSPVTQQDNGQFTMAMSANNFSANYTWHETYDDYFCGMFGCSKTDSNDNTYGYSVGIGNMTITIVFQFKFNANQWQLTLLNSTPATSGISPNIPSRSIVNSEQSSGCFSTTFSSATAQSVSAIDFSSPINALLTPLFSSIPSSGNLTPNIVFQFPMGASGLTFPNNAGIATGVTANVTCKGQSYAGANPPQLPLPAIPSDHHLNYFASDYTFNALMWAFYEEGDLVATATPGNIPNPAALNTSNYQNTPLQALYNAYPNTPMTANIKALQAPTVSFATIYDLTANNIVNLQSQLPAAIYTQLQTLKGQAFMTEAAFYTQLVNALGAANAAQYKTVIEAVAQVVGGVVTHSNQVIMNVVSGGQTIPVITFNVSQTDVLQNFQLGIAGTTQTLQFAFQIVDGLTSTTFVSSSITGTGIDSGDFSFIWNWVLQNVFASEVALIGQAGVALPRMQGFNFLFSNAIVTLQPGYASVLADVQHISDNGVLYLMSKKRVQLQDAHWKPAYRNRDEVAYA